MYGLGFLDLSDTVGESGVSIGANISCQSQPILERNTAEQTASPSRDLL